MATVTVGITLTSGVGDLLTDGLSQIWDVETEKEAERISTMLTENSDSGWVYKIRKTCERK